MNFLILFLVAIFIIFIFYFVILLILHDFSFKNLDLVKFLGPKNSKYNVLFVYPHPDDDVMASGGLMNRLSKDSNFNIYSLCLTKGEKGDELVKIGEEALGNMRQQEYIKAMDNIGIKNSIIEDFGDGNVSNRLIEVKKYLLSFINIHEIDLIVTYERTGMYGHKDHVANSLVVNDIKNIKDVLKVLYLTLPEKIEKRYDMKGQIKNLELDKSSLNEQPEFKVWIFWNLLAKYNAARKYKSQNLSHGVPLWLLILLMPVEYYTSKYDSRAE